MAYGRTIDISKYLRSGLSSMLSQDLCTDFEVVVGGRTFRCHKVVLAALSDYFQAMFTSRMKETVENKCVLSDVEPEVFENILDLIYDESGDKVNHFMKNTPHATDEYLRISIMLQMKFLQDLCLKKIKVNLKVQNCIEIWKMGKTLQMEGLQELGFDYVLSHFEELVAEELLLSLEYDEFKSLAENKELKVAKEETVCNAVLAWVSFEEARKEKLPALLKCCSLSQLDTKYLASFLSFHPLCRKNEEALAVIEDAVRFKFNKGQHGNLSVFLRNCTSLEQMPVLLLGKANESEDPFGSIPVYGDSETENAWITLEKPNGRYPVGKDFACCVYGTSIFLTGGENGKKLNIRYDDDKRAWTKRRDMPEALWKHTMTANNDFVYVLGGCFPNSYATGSNSLMNDKIFIYNILDNTWETLLECKFVNIVPVKKPSSVCLDTKIYVIGGLLATDEGTDVIQVFDIDKKNCSVFCHLPKPCEFLRAVCDTKNIFVVTDCGDIVKFNGESTDVELVGTGMHNNCKCTSFGVVLCGDVLSVYGGIHIEDSAKVSRKVRRWNVVSKRALPSWHLRIPGKYKVYESLLLVVRLENCSTLSSIAANQSSPEYNSSQE